MQVTNPANPQNSVQKGGRQMMAKFSMNIPVELKRRLKVHCAQYDRSVSSLILSLLESYLRKQEQEQNKPIMEADRWRRGL